MNDKVVLLDFFVYTKQLLETEIINVCTSKDYFLSKKTGLSCTFSNEKYDSRDLNECVMNFTSVEAIKKIIHEELVFDPRKCLLTPFYCSGFKPSSIFKNIEALLLDEELPFSLDYFYDSGYKCFEFDFKNTANVAKKSLQDSIEKVAEESNTTQLERSSELITGYQVNEELCEKIARLLKPRIGSDNWMTVSDDQPKFQNRPSFKMAEFESQTNKQSGCKKNELVSIASPISTTQLKCLNSESEMPALSKKNVLKADLDELTNDESVSCKIMKDKCIINSPDEVNMEHKDVNKNKPNFNDSVLSEYWIEQDPFFQRLIFGDSSDANDSEDFFDSKLDVSLSSGSNTSLLRNELDKKDSNCFEEIQLSPTDSSANGSSFVNDCLKRKKRNDSGVDFSYDIFQQDLEFPPLCKCETSYSICDDCKKEFKIGLESVTPKKNLGGQRDHANEKSKIANYNRVNSENKEIQMANILCSLCKRAVQRFGHLLSCEHIFCFECISDPFGNYGLSMDIITCPCCKVKSPGFVASDCLLSSNEKEASFHKLAVECIRKKVLMDCWREKIWTTKQNKIKMNVFCANPLNYRSIFVW